MVGAALVAEYDSPDGALGDRALPLLVFAFWLPGSDGPSLQATLVVGR